ncbi:DNA/RNA non-specific endonuclease [uncultured Lutibacter sp.]|uniref:DNA/RNA non-specific endonuclease n=1 Tax=uncultured Lutibacter sp. TaxID=437739 RepID=UPI0026214CA8|nr:DNA/RNA non-specific endonuclease [uncultured Lutibacter sp.]
MKNRKPIYIIITLVFAIGFYIYDNYLVENKAPKIEVSEKSNQESSTVDLTPTSTTNQLVKHKYYSLSYHEKYEQAEWVAYELKKEQITSQNFKRPYFIFDSKVTTKSAHYKNYSNSGYDKGHLCPAADMKFSEDAFNETFLTSNISPQNHDFNSGIWNRLEQKTRYWAQRYDKLYIITGGVLTNNLKTIGSEKVAVPNYFYKIILDNSEPEIKAIAFLIPHEESEKGLYQFVVSIDEIERLTGIDFFPALPNELENKLEQSSSYSNWSLR